MAKAAFILPNVVEILKKHSIIREDETDLVRRVELIVDGHAGVELIITKFVPVSVAERVIEDVLASGKEEKTDG